MRYSNGLAEYYESLSISELVESREEHSSKEESLEFKLRLTSERLEELPILISSYKEKYDEANMALKDRTNKLVEYRNKLKDDCELEVIIDALEESVFSHTIAHAELNTRLKMLQKEYDEKTLIQSSALRELQVLEQIGIILKTVLDKKSGEKEGIRIYHHPSKKVG